MSKRETALAYIRIAGYHEDQKSFVRLYVENRISYQVAIASYRLGYQQKQNGMKCVCFECKK